MRIVQRRSSSDALRTFVDIQEMTNSVASPVPVVYMNVSSEHADSVRDCCLPRPSSHRARRAKGSLHKGSKGQCLHDRKFLTAGNLEEYEVMRLPEGNITHRLSSLEIQVRRWQCVLVRPL